MFVAPLSLSASPLFGALPLRRNTQNTKVSPCISDGLPSGQGVPPTRGRRRKHKKRCWAYNSTPPDWNSIQAKHNAPIFNRLFLKNAQSAVIMEVRCGINRGVEWLGHSSSEHSELALAMLCRYLCLQSYFTSTIDKMQDQKRAFARFFHISQNDFSHRFLIQAQSLLWFSLVFPFLAIWVRFFNRFADWLIFFTFLNLTVFSRKISRKNTHRKNFDTVIFTTWRRQVEISPRTFLCLLIEKTGWFLLFLQDLLKFSHDIRCCGGFRGLLS